MQTRTHKSRHSLIAMMGAGIALPACGGSGTRPADMSAAEHRQAADEEEASAAEHSEHDDRAGIQTGYTGSTANTDVFAEGVYNPIAVHAELRAQHRELAEAHRAAAQALESFEDAECGAFPASTRASCPLLGQVVSVEDIEGGARANFGEGVNVNAAAAHIACHLTYARTEGHEGMNECPLYLRGVQSARSGPSSVDFTIDGDVAELRTRLGAHVVH